MNTQMVKPKITHLIVNQYCLMCDLGKQEGNEYECKAPECDCPLVNGKADFSKAIQALRLSGWMLNMNFNGVNLSQ